MDNGVLIGNAKYNINKVNNVEVLKDYYIINKNYSGAFGSNDVICATGSGNERFYVMALTDIDGQQDGTLYYWYGASNGNMTDYSSTTSEVFGAGKKNTQTMIEKWKNKSYGAQDYGKYKDIWGQIQTQANEGWFVPSRGEWSAFAEELGITEDNYGNKKLSLYYWSSSQSINYSAYGIAFNGGYIGGGDVSKSGHYVRLSITF